MNESTRIAVCCYTGDQHYVIKALGNYLQHECPVVVLSPEDSKAEIRYPGIENRYGGKRAYIGQDSLDRQRKHLEILLTFPENHFLIHDSDSICLAPEIPTYLYREPDIVWSNLVNDPIPEHQPAYPPGFPHIAFQPPYFLSRATIQRLLSVPRESVLANPTMPFIDHFMVQLALAAGCEYRGFPDGVSFPTDPTQVPAIEMVANRVREGQVIFMHSIKRPEIYQRFVRERQEFLRTHPCK